MSNPNIAKQASKGGKARWIGVSKKKRRDFALKAVYTRWARQRDAKLDKARTDAI